MKTNNNIPAYRFQGYTDAWELRKLGDTDTIFTDGNYGEAYPKDSDLTTSSNGVPFLRGSNIQDGKLNLDNANYITISKHNELTSGHLEEDDIVIAVRGSLGSVGYVEEDNIGWNINSQLAIIRTNKYEITGRYLIQILLSDSGKKMINSLVTGTALKQLPIKNLKKIQFSIPSLPEQEAIGTFFSTLDRHITLHQRKLDTLKEQKKSYLKLLFPAKGQTKPALRFQGFEDDWEEVKLGDVVEKSGSGGTPKSTNKSYYGGSIPFLSITDITQSGKYITNTEKTLTELGLENSSAWIVPKGAISLAMYASVGKLAILKTDVATSQAFFNMVFSNEIVRDYVYFILDKAQLFNEWLPLISTGTQGNLNAQKLKEYSIPLPSLPEQEVIGTFFSTLDQKITQVEDKLASLKEMKKTLLRKLFV